MKNFARRIAVVVGAVAVSVGLIGATAARPTPATAPAVPAPRLQLALAEATTEFETRTRLSPHLSGPSAYPPGPSQQHEGSDRRVAALVTFRRRTRNGAGTTEPAE